MSIIRQEYVYSKTHEWVKQEGNRAKIGITDFAQHSLGSIVYVDLPATQQVFKQGDEFGAIESVKAASELFLPVSGKIVAVNEALEDHPELINENPYAAWIVEVELSRPDELKSLLTAAAYAKLTN